MALDIPNCSASSVYGTSKSMSAWLIGRRSVTYKASFSISLSRARRSGPTKRPKVSAAPGSIVAPWSPARLMIQACRLCLFNSPKWMILASVAAVALSTGCCLGSDSVSTKTKSVVGARLVK